ncbi:MAG: putative transcriptional regulator, TetR family [Nocardia sp.]|uniref:TetR/AcrR family transcriptional regulator n=1 Tax=Nocardia sp. TaxID=1821 RepID=UPI00260D5C1B|nr:TetR/AcrR family transcriptional regulator [Nocardia sp.]MCU1639960.1 putative transcriptional regulator, TetR family [Nocardia sp.]
MADARTERWVTHRAQVRRSLVESAMRAIDVTGPQVSMREIAAEAKIPKPTLYRFFADKSELANAIGDRVRDTLTERIANGPTETGATLGTFLHSGIATYLELADEHPNIFRFVMLTMSESTEFASEGINRVTTPAMDLAAVLRTIVKALGGTDTDVDLTAYMLVGSIMSAGHWWLIHGGADGADMSRIIDKVEQNARALIQTTAHANGIHLDFDAPIAGYFAAAPIAVAK